MEQEKPIEPLLFQLMNEIGQIIGSALQVHTISHGEKYGFALFMFGLEGGESSRMNYISNCRREDMLAALKEFIARNEGTYQEANFTKKRHM